MTSPRPDSGYEATVAAIMRTAQCDRARAEEIARLNGFAPPVIVHAGRDADALEKQEQEYVKRLFREFGFKVRNLSQARRSKQAPGVPDLFCTHRALAIAFWWESKRQVGGRLSDAQVEFRRDCERCHVGYGTGDRHAARTHLIHLGLARVEGDVLEPIRREGTG